MCLREARQAEMVEFFKSEYTYLAMLNEGKKLRVGVVD